MVIGDRLQVRHQEIVARMSDVIAREVDYLNDPELMAMLRASVDSNISTILHIIRNDIPLEHVQPITAATEYALRLAQRGVPGASLRRAYHFGSDDLRTWIFEEVEQLDCGPDVKLKLLHHLAGFMHKYIDWITQLVLEAHEDERQRWIAQSASETASLVARVLDRLPVAPTEFATRTGYRLDQVHVAAVIWIDGANSGTDQTDALSDLARRLATVLGCGSSVLLTAVDRGTVWVWFGRGREAAPVDVEPVRLALQGPPEVTGRSGTADRRHRRLPTIARAGRVGQERLDRVLQRGRPMRSASASAACRSSRCWCATWPLRDAGCYEVLGPLAEDAEAVGRTRETLRVFLGAGGSYTQTSELLLLHRNSVKYRIRKAEDERGRPWRTIVSTSSWLCRCVTSWAPQS